MFLKLNYLICFLFYFSKENIVNLNVERSINLINEVTYIEINITIKNTDLEPIDNYDYIIFKNYSKFLLTINVDSNNCHPEIKKLNDNEIYEYYKITFEPLNQNEEITITINEHYFNSFIFLPEKITLKQDQKMLYKQTLNFLSSYLTKNQKTEIFFEKKNIRLINYTKENSTLTENGLEYKIRANIKPYETIPFTIHYINNDPYVIINKAYISYKISHWGNIEVNQQFNIENIGAKLDGEFDRNDYDPTNIKGGRNAFTQLEAELPLRSWGLWYRDEIGNVSTSNAIREWDNVKLYLYPRFPILGGWKSNFGIGFNLPSKFHVNTDNNGNFKVSLNFGMPFNDIVAKNYSMEIILPSGAYVNKIDLPIKSNYILSFGKYFGTLDFFGRKSIIIELNNVYDIHNIIFQIEYKFSSINLILKPLILIFYFFFIFMCIIFYSRSNFSLSKEQKIKEE